MSRSAQMVPERVAGGPVKRVAGIVAVCLFALAAAATPLLAKERISISRGTAACKAWCDKNNATAESAGQCYIRCERYWLCNGSDSTADSCAGAPRVASDGLQTLRPDTSVDRRPDTTTRH